jgi:predicted phosphate transport protein (TIGR00153 family)
MMRIIPREEKFFQLFADMTANVAAAAELLARVLKSGEEMETAVQQLKQIERKGDEITHEVLMKLNQTFVTPLDREDIHRLASTLDDVLDFIYAAGERLVMYDIREIPVAASDLAAVIIRQCDEISRAVGKLEAHDQVLVHCREINRLENEADRIARSALAALFRSHTQPIELIKLKELIEMLETATDKAEDVANVMESIVLKNA